MDELNRQLLVAVLALLTDAIPRPGLAAALKAWNKDRRQSLALLLKEEAALDEERLRALECLASAHLKTHHNDLRLGLEAWNAYELTQDVLTEVGDDALRETLSMTLTGNTTLPVSSRCSETEAAGSDFQIANPAPAVVPGERFQLIREHARGGIGQVWLARDSELQREVALKEIQPKYAEREDQRARFLLEAEITGNLEHPGIVPVYSLGRNAEGRPYYAMRFIRGESLSVAIRRFHHKSQGQAGTADKKSTTIWGIEFRQLLGRFLDVCDAMDYAHSRNVIHRDLKPANIMLGRYGETLVVDWGLAKVLGRTDVIPAPPDGEFEPGLAGMTVTFSGETQAGLSIGTPSYMSPEQARGSLDQIGRTSDVYSLGATLYELLTGQVAFPGDNAKQVIDKVIKGDFPSPRTVYRSLPLALEAICLKAMARQPQQRYPSVRALAQDIEHWLADEPVAAYPERRLERLGRWLRQHRTWTYAAATGLVGISVAAIIAAVVIDGARRREALVRQEAESNFIMAQSAVEEYLTKVSENTLLKEQDSVDIRSLRQELLESALKYYQRFVQQRGDDPILRKQLANAYYLVGVITQEIESPLQAIEAFRSAQTILESQLAANPDDDDIQGRLADCHLAIGKQQAALGDLQGAMMSFNQARDMLEKLASRHHELATYQSSLADCYTEIGIIQGQLESGDHGLAILEKAKAIQQRLIERGRGELESRKRLAEIINAIGFVQFKRADFPAAFRSFQAVKEICEALINEITLGPKPVTLLNLLALAHYNIASIQLADKQFDKALESYENSLKYRSDLVDAHPSVTVFKENLGNSCREVGIGQHTAGQDEKAFASLLRSIGIFDKLVQSEPNQARYHAELGRSWNAMACLHDEMRDNDRAIPEFLKAVNEQEIAIDRSPDDNEYKGYLCNHLENLGEQYADLNRAADAFPYYQRAMEFRRRLHASQPENRGYALLLADALSRLGTLQRHAGDSAAARDSFADASGVVEKQAVSPGDPATEVLRGAALIREAWAEADLKQSEKALQLLQQAIDLLEPLSKSPSPEAQARVWLTEALQERARVLRTMNQPADADKSDSDRAVLWKGQPPGELAALALTQAGRAALIGYGKSAVSGPAESIRELDLEQAASNLRLAISNGFTDLRMLKANSDFSLLVSRDDLTSLIKGLETPDQPAEAQPKK